MLLLRLVLSASSFSWGNRRDGVGDDDDDDYYNVQQQQQQQRQQQHAKGDTHKLELDLDLWFGLGNALALLS